MPKNEKMNQDESPRHAWISEIFPNPFFNDDDTRIIVGDSMELLEQIPPKSIDLVVTSPPYNIGKEYERRLPLNEYLDWCEQWLCALHRVVTDTGTLWLNLGYVPVLEKGKAVPLSYLLWDRSPFFMIQEIVWNYGAGVASRNSYSPRNEKFLWFVKNPDSYVFNLDAVRDPNVKYPNQKKNGKLKVNPLGKNPSDVWQIPKVTSGANRSSKERAPHPAQFPEALIERIILASSHAGDLIFDPFVGSGTTCAVANRLNRASIGIEIQPNYASFAAKRIGDQIRVGSLPFEQCQ